MQRVFRFLSLLLTPLLLLALPSCSSPRKRITVVIREAGSGTREGFDRTVTNGTHFLEERDENGKKIYRSVRDATVQTKTGTVLSTVAHDVHAIGYVSLDSVNNTVKLLSINGISPSEESVARGDYPISRPFVILTTRRVPLSPVASDFLLYLKSELAADHVRAAGCTPITDPAQRANPDAPPIPIVTFSRQSALPSGGRVILRGSTSLERLITSAARGYAALYGVDPTEIFDIQLEGSAIGRRAVLDDRTGNVIGLSSADVTESGIESFRLCLDAIAVIVHPKNPLDGLSLSQLYDVFAGNVRHFDELGGIS